MFLSISLNYLPALGRHRPSPLLRPFRLMDGSGDRGRGSFLPSHCQKWAVGAG